MSDGHLLQVILVSLKARAHQSHHEDDQFQGCCECKRKGLNLSLDTFKAPSLPNAGGGKTIHRTKPAPQIPLIIEPANVSSLFRKKNVLPMHHMIAARDRTRKEIMTLRLVLL